MMKNKVEKKIQIQALAFKTHKTFYTDVPYQVTWIALTCT